ncbi:MAG TPA: hypothetical protein DGO43_06050 [Chloroflexi bacterium]|nr:hypothetical protein [Chloroflexota bacterium]|tara:strand:+ start:1127 stop:2134 length:1008 start_codon:yes stop_codon:yes gene_type:complete
MPTTTPQINFGAGSTVSIDTVEIPDPEPNQLLVKATRSLISAGTEHNMLESTTQATRAPGYSLVGQIAEVGEAVKGYTAGDRVLTYLKHQGSGLVTIDPDIYEGEAYAGHIPDDVGDEEAAFVVLGDVALHGVRRAGPSIGDSVAVFGQGSLGQMVTQFSRMAGAYPVIAVDLLDERLRLAERSGASHTVNADREDSVSAIEEITRGGARFVFMVTRTPKILPDCLRAAAAGGTVSLTGSPPGTVEIGLQEELLRKELKIIGTHQRLYPRTPFHHFQWTRGANRQFIFDALSREDFHVAHLISHRVPYQQATDMYAMIARGPQGWQSIVLEWDGA